MTAQLTLPQSSSSQSGMALFEKIEFYLLVIGFSTFIYFPSIILQISFILLCIKIFFHIKYDHKIVVPQLKNIFFLIILLIVLKLIFGLVHHPERAFFVGWNSQFQVLFRNGLIYAILLMYLMSSNTFHHNHIKISYCLIFSFFPMIFLLILNNLWHPSYIIFSKFIRYWPNGSYTAFYHFTNPRAISISAVTLLAFNLIVRNNNKKHSYGLLCLIILSLISLYFLHSRASVISILIAGSIQFYFTLTNSKNRSFKKNIYYLTLFAMLLMVSLIVLNKRQSGLVHHIKSMVSINSTPINPQVEKRKKIVIEKIKQQAKQQSLQSGLNQQVILNNIAKSYGFNTWQMIENIPRNIVDPAQNIRLLYYHYAISSILEKPLLGHGYYTFGDNLKASPFYQKRNWIRKNLFEGADLVIQPIVHNYYLEILYDYGLIYFIFNMVLFFFTIKLGTNNKFKFIYLSPIILLFIAIITDPFLMWLRPVVLFSYIQACNLSPLK